MSNQEWGVTERGFHRPTYVELLDAIEYKARELFGSKANLTVRSPLGIFLRIFAWMLNILFSLMEDVYNSRFVDTAVGTSLYNLGKAIGLSLLPEQYAVLAAGRIDDTGKVTLPVQAVETGADYNVAAETVKEITNPMDGVSACTNPAAIDGGRGRETDEEFRDRYYQSVDYAGGVNADAIAGEIMQNVDAVYSAICYENDTDETDALGLPPHSIEAIVYGGLDADIAQAIFRRKAAGIQTSGSSSIAVIAKSGQSINIKFSRPTTVAVYIQIKNLETNSDFPGDGQDRIKEALVEYIGGDVRGGLTIGSDVLYMALPGVILSVPGVVDFDLGISETASDYGEENIVIDTREKAVTSTDKITIAEVS